ncbi:high affinity immunoglobulin epsilon receptor subunit alpha-like, partial [Embiotoca jacksoni]|uniref:high affinity immunoglobulin epsilon receptor subunit alpha-like n=1 Tax=Embiotoca jacksoni TaxID=100190 RepID=UPI003704D439
SSFLSPGVNVFVLLAAQVHFAQKADAAFPHISPNRLQFFVYESFSVRCGKLDLFTEWRVMRSHGNIPANCSETPNTSASSCTIKKTFQRHSGEYWCENEQGERSDAVNITVTGGSVILDIPAQPVIEGNDVSLRCMKENSESRHIADFYKDGVGLDSKYKSSIAIQNISKSDEGLYKCSMSGVGESPASRLLVFKQSEETPPSHSVSPQTFILLWTLSSVVLVALLLLMGVLLSRKHKVLTEGSVIDPHHATYAVVKKQRNDKGGDAVDQDDVTNAAVQKYGKKKEPEASRATTPRLLEDNIIYSSVNCH